MKHEQSRDAELWRHVRMRARSMQGRIYRHKDRLYLVRGDPEFHQLQRCLAGMHKAPAPDDAPDPVALGFAAEEVALAASEDIGACSISGFTPAAHSTAPCDTTTPAAGSRPLPTIPRATSMPTGNWRSSQLPTSTLPPETRATHC